MITIYDLKKSFQNLLRPLVIFLAKHGVTANIVTISALMLSIIMGGFIALFPNQIWILWFVPPIMFIRMALNAIDGMLAREHNMQSRLGSILNELGDVLSDTALFLPFALISGILPELIILIVIFAIISEMTGVLAIQIKSTRRYDGPMGKSDRAFIFGLASVLLASNLTTTYWINILFFITLLLLVLTVYNRAAKALKNA